MVDMRKVDMRKVWGKIRRQKRNAEIIKAIKEGYTSTSAIARHLGLSCTTIMYSARDLEREGAIKSQYTIKEARGFKHGRGWISTSI